MTSKGLISRIKLSSNVVKVAFSNKPSKLVVDGYEINNFNYEDGWWTTEIASIDGYGTVYFNVSLIEARGIFKDYYEYDVNVKPGILAVIIPNNFNIKLITPSENTLTPYRVYNYDMFKLVCEFPITESGRAKLILTP